MGLPKLVPLSALAMKKISFPSLHVMYTLLPNATIRGLNAAVEALLLRLTEPLKVVPLLVLLAKNISPNPLGVSTQAMYTLPPETAICGPVELSAVLLTFIVLPKLNPEACSTVIVTIIKELRSSTAIKQDTQLLIQAVFNQLPGSGVTIIDSFSSRGVFMPYAPVTSMIIISSIKNVN
ncbi:hypothetical protein [Nitrososphaera sp.]|uniref:hypothetical protein n=1 Tax=Nitrososphaera sp. TaxID=1971748 RepID=UPI003182410A